MNPQPSSFSHKIASNLLTIIESTTPIREFYKNATYMSHRNDPIRKFRPKN